MGSLIAGKWVDKWRDTKSTGGHFVRPPAKVRNWITPDGGPGPSGEGGFAAAAGRYHLYVAMSCPWAHRTMIFRALKGLEGMISISVVNPVADQNGWNFFAGHGVIADDVNGADYLYEVYLEADPEYTGLVTVPTLWDQERQTLVSNESADIIRMFNSAFDAIGALEGDYYPAGLRPEIDKVNELVYRAINNGVYRTGFATSQEAHDDAYTRLFDALDELDQRLASQRFLVGEHVTEADWRLYTTLVRFDIAYFGPLKCNKRRLVDYANLWAYVRELHHMPGIAATFDAHAIKQHYYTSRKMFQPSDVVPRGPEIDFAAPHGRG